MDILRILIEGSTTKKPEKSKFSVGAKVIGKNILSDTVAGAAAGVAAAAMRQKHWKLGVRGGIAGAGLGALWGAGEGAIKYHLLKNKSKADIEKTVSHPAYKYGNLVNKSVDAGVVGTVVNRMADKRHFADMIGKAGKAGKPMGKWGKIAAVAVPVAGAIATDLASDSANEALQSKIYGPERSSVTGTEELYTKRSLNAGMGSKKKYHAFGLGPEIKKKKATTTK